MLSSLFSLVLIITEVLAVLAIILVLYARWSHTYWRRRHLSSLEPPFFFGHMVNPIVSKDPVGIHFRNIYNQIKRKGWKHCGIYLFTRPTYMPLDLDYVKNVMTKDFQYFTDRGTYYNERDDPLSAHLFAIGGVKWRNLRTKLTPTFTSGKMKMMFQTLLECEKSLEHAVEDCRQMDKPVDIKEVFARFTTNIIGSCAFGLECNTFQEEESPFRKYGKKIFERDVIKALTIILALNYPELARTMHVRFFPQDVTHFFMKVVRDTIAFREKNKVKRNDFLQMLMDMKSDDDKHDGTSLTMNELAAQCFVFFIAGFETSSTTSTFTLYELAKHQEVQDKVRQEIEEVLGKHDGQITYEAINEMKYMNQVIDEGLRKYPPVPFVTRECVKDYPLPESDTVLEKGTRVMIPIWGIHMDSEYYPDPEKFDPERFTEENKHKRHPYAHIPFGEGPRICIGMRFGLMQTKVGLTSLIKNYKFTVSGKTKQPLRFAKNSFIPTTEGDIWLSVEKIRK